MYYLILYIYFIVEVNELIYFKKVDFVFDLWVNNHYSYYQQWKIKTNNRKLIVVNKLNIVQFSFGRHVLLPFFRYNGISASICSDASSISSLISDDVPLGRGEMESEGQESI